METRHLEQSVVREGRFDQERMLRAARMVLERSRFEVETKGAVLEAWSTGTGARGSLGSTRLHLEVLPDRIVLRSAIHGVRRLQLFLLAFPVALALSLGATFHLMGHPAWTVVGWTAAPWLVLAPLFSSWLGRRTRRTLASFADELCAAAS